MRRSTERAKAEALKQAEAAVVKASGPQALTPELKQAFKAMLFGQPNG